MVLLNLVATDIVISSVGLPLDFAAALNRGWTFGRTFCNFLGFLHTFTGFYLIFEYMKHCLVANIFRYWFHLYFECFSFFEVFDPSHEKSKLI
jgi:hypothetical protein